MEKFNEKFKLSELTIYKSKHWTWSLREDQVTLGSSVLSLNRECASFSEISLNESEDLKRIVQVLEATLQKLFTYDRINYLMLMMQDFHVHFHVIPRYQEQKDLLGFTWQDSDWPKPSNLKKLGLDHEILIELLEEIKNNLSKT